VYIYNVFVVFWTFCPSYFVAYPEFFVNGGNLISRESYDKQHYELALIVNGQRITIDDYQMNVLPLVSETITEGQLTDIHGLLEGDSLQIFHVATEYEGLTFSVTLVELGGDVLWGNATTTSPLFSTPRGLRIGDSVSRLMELYPNVDEHWIEENVYVFSPFLSGLWVITFTVADGVVTQIALVRDLS